MGSGGLGLAGGTLHYFDDLIFVFRDVCVNFPLSTRASKIVEQGRACACQWLMADVASIPEKANEDRYPRPWIELALTR